MGLERPGDFRHAFVSILTAGLLALQCLFFWSVVFAAIWYLSTDYDVFFDQDEVQSFPMQVAEIVVPVIGVVASLAIAPWIAWTYLRSAPRKPSGPERFGAGFIIVANLAFVLWVGLEIAYWPPDIFDIATMVSAGLIAVLVTSVSFSRRPVGLSAG